MKHIYNTLIACALLLVMGACADAPAADPALKVITMNMRYDNPADGDNNWNYRYDEIARMLLREQPDLMGTQELLAHQLDTLKARMTDYATIGIAREDGIRQGEHSAIFYRKDRFEEVSSGNFWLSETPDKVGSFGWDAACVRIATWAVLRDRSGRELFFLNTHFDHEGKVARQKSGDLLVDRVKALAGDRPVIVTGDFNADPESDVIRNILSKNVLRHARDIAAERYGADWSFTSFGTIPEEERILIDYIFVGGPLSVDRYEVMPETNAAGRHYSDHAPVKAILHYN